MNGGSGTGDGRLDLDDLGEVIDAATTVDADARTEVLDDGRGRTWGDRLEDAGITPWLRRHRVAVAVTTAACVIVGAGAAAYARWAPPPFDTEMRVTLTELVPEQVVVGDFPLTSVAAGPMGVGDRARAAYGLTPEDSRDTSAYTLLGLDGPVVRASSTSPHAATGGDVPVAADVDVILDCADPSALDPAPGSYALRVARTDAWGRTLVAAVPVPDGPTGWPAYVAANCADKLTVDGMQLRGVAVRDTGRAGVVGLDLDVVNRLPVDVSVTAIPSGGFPVVVPTLAATPIAAGATARLPMDLVVHDCTAPTLYPIGVTDPDEPEPTYGGSAPGAYLKLDLRTRASAADPGIPAPVGGAEVHWSTSMGRQIDAALAGSCTGGPPRAPEVRVAAVGRPVPAQKDLPGTIFTTDTDVFLVLRIATSGSRVAIVTPPTPPDWFVGSSTAPASAPVRDGVATVRTTWSFSCEGGGYSPPPTVGVVVTTTRGEFPFQAQLNSAQLTRAILDDCSTADEQQLVDSGWVAPTPRKYLLKTGA